MTSAIISGKNQVTIPKSVRDDLGVGPGDRLEFIKLSENRYEMIAASIDISSLKGIIKTRRKVSIEDMNKLQYSKSKCSETGYRHEP